MGARTTYVAAVTMLVTSASSRHWPLRLDPFCKSWGFHKILRRPVLDYKFPSGARSRGPLSHTHSLSPLNTLEAMSLSAQQPTWGAAPALRGGGWHHWGCSELGPGPEVGVRIIRPRKNQRGAWETRRRSRGVQGAERPEF